MDTTSILREVKVSRRREEVWNTFKFFGIVCLVLILGGCAVVLAEPVRGPEIVAAFAVACLVSVFDFVLTFVLVFWPFLLYFWGNVQMMRQQIFLSLIQAALETNTPLQSIIHTYASGCSRRYARRLNKFADALDAGRSLDEVLRDSGGLLRYDVAGIIRFGDNAPETLRSIETVAQDEKDFSAIKSLTFVRIAYLCTLGGSLLMVALFLLTKIIPQFEKIFCDFGTVLPSLTVFVIALSNTCCSYWYFTVLFLWFAVLVLVVYLILQTNVVIFRPPGFRRMFRSTDAAKFLMVFAVGIRHRFPIPAIVKMYAWTVPSQYLRRKGLKIQAMVENGGDWIDAVCRSGFVNTPEASLLRSAERTGNTAAVLDQLAQSKERSQMRKDDLLSKFTFISLIFLAGIIIGTFVIAMFLPLITLITALT